MNSSVVIDISLLILSLEHATHPIAYVKWYIGGKVNSPCSGQIIVIGVL